jgi:hypothetical protein
VLVERHKPVSNFCSNSGSSYIEHNIAICRRNFRGEKKFYLIINSRNNLRRHSISIGVNNLDVFRTSRRIFKLGLNNILPRNGQRVVNNYRLP